jgi:DNA-binding NtrC family response regulator
MKKSALEIKETSATLFESLKVVASGKNDGKTSRSQDISILIVDDEPAMTRMMSSMLNNTGSYKCEIANSGEEALELFQTTQPDYVILDLFLPDMNGMEIFRALRHLDPSVKVIIMSGYSGLNQLEITSQGVVSIIDKPFSVSRLVNLIEGLRNQETAVMRHLQDSDEQLNSGDIEVKYASLPLQYKIC